MSETSVVKKCKDCDKDAIESLRQHVYCEECFQEACLHLFRATFGKNRVVRDGEKVLVAVSGGSGSLAMMILVTLGLRPLVARKLRFQPLFFHLDESELFGGSEIMDSVRQSFQRAGNELHVLRFEELLPNAPALTALLKQRAEQTARVALHDIFRRRALLAATRQLGCSRLLLGDSSSRVASRALEEVLQGRGASVGAATAFADNRFEPTLLRPMLELSSSECAALVRLAGLTTAAEPRGAFSRSVAMATLQGLTGRVLRDLEPSFPATNFAILRTAAKMQPPSPDGPRCALCQSVIDWEDRAEGESAVQDLRFCHETATGRAVFQDTRLCYGCHVLALKHDPLRSWLAETLTTTLSGGDG